MRVLVIGATGGTGKLLAEQLLEAGHHVRAMSRDADRLEPLRGLGAETVTADLEGELDHAFTDIDAVAFCAGSGGHTGADATLRVDLHGAVRTFDLCRDHGIQRYVMLSSIAADDPLRGSEKIRHYLAAKHAADRLLLASGLDATIVRPGGLTDDEPTGRVSVGVPRLPVRGQIPRADVAAVMASCLGEPATTGLTFELIAGETPIAQAIAEIGR
jgi:uncharacterized protein YbjT (DUF2867 family)